MTPSPGKADDSNATTLRGRMARAARHMFRFVNMLAAALFAAGYVGRYVHPADFWVPQLFALMLVPLSAGLVLCLVVAVSLKERRMFVLNILVLSAALIRYAPVERLHDPDPASASDTLSVVSFNTSNQTSRDGETIAELILDSAPDVVALQETPVIFAENTAAIGSDRELWSLFRHYGLQKPGMLVGSGQPKIMLPILSVREFGRYEELEIRKDGSPDHSGNLVFTRAELLIADSWVAVYNVHLRSYGPGPRRHGIPISRRSLAFWWDKGRTFASDTRIRAEEAEAIRKILDRESLPFIVCGDFNSTPDMWVYQHLSSGLQDVFRSAGGLWGGTFYADFPALRIDYILVSRDWTIHDAGVPHTRISDHRPVTARLSLRPTTDQHLIE